jgi:hypothetical protein
MSGSEFVGSILGVILLASILTLIPDMFHYLRIGKM